MKNIKLLGDRIVVKQDDPDSVTKTGFVLPKTAQKQIMFGEVLAVGEGRWIERLGKVFRQKMVIKKKDKVIYPRYTGMNFKEATLILRQRDIICIVKKNNELFPLEDRVVVKPGKQITETNTGLLLPAQVKERPNEGKVIAVGLGKTLENDLRLPLDIKIGDEVIYSKFGGVEIKVDDEPYMVLFEHEILGVKEGKDCR